MTHKRLLNWLESHLPEVLNDLASLASKEQISELENKLSITLPEELADLYLSHNGQKKYYSYWTILWTWFSIS